MRTWPFCKLTAALAVGMSLGACVEVPEPQPTKQVAAPVAPVTAPRRVAPTPSQPVATPTAPAPAPIPPPNPFNDGGGGGGWS